MHSLRRFDFWESSGWLARLVARCSSPTWLLAAVGQWHNNSEVITLWCATDLIRPPNGPPVILHIRHRNLLSALTTTPATCPQVGDLLIGNLSAFSKVNTLNITIDAAFHTQCWGLHKIYERRRHLTITELYESKMRSMTFATLSNHSYTPAVIRNEHKWVMNQHV